MCARASSATKRCGAPCARGSRTSLRPSVSKSWASSPPRSREVTVTASSCSAHAVAERVTITRLGARADGVADGESGPIFVPYALPGETVAVERDGERAHLVAVETPSPAREEPFCPYFGTCGGCATQHMGHDLYRTWKRDTVVETLRRARIEPPVADLVDAHGEGRRRITLHARFPEGATRVGYMAARSHAVVEIAFCPIAVPALRERASEIARALAQRLAQGRKPLDIQITATGSGLAVDLRGHGPARERQELVALAAELDLAR